MPRISFATSAVCVSKPLSRTWSGDLLLNDQLVLRINGNLNVVAHPNTGMRRHRSAVGISQRDLVLSRALQLR